MRARRSLASLTAVTLRASGHNSKGVFRSTDTPQTEQTLAHEPSPMTNRRCYAHMLCRQRANRLI